MSTFYLPIKIAHRRMHICHLAEAGSSVRNIAEFVVPNQGNDPTLFTIDNVKIPGSGSVFSTGRTVQPKFVSGASIREDQMLKGLMYKVAKKEIDTHTLEIAITFSKASGEKDQPLENDSSRILVKGDQTGHFFARTSNQTPVRKITFTLIYVHQGQDPNSTTSYSYTFIVHLPRVDHTTEIYKVAIDFGSEASQIGYKMIGDDQTYSIPILGVLRDFYEQYKDVKSFWQGIYEDDDLEARRLFQSFFFVNRNPVQGFHYEDLPNQHRKDSFLQSLTPTAHTGSATGSSTGFSYAGLTLLPNLKLVELLNNANFRDDQIDFTGNANKNGQPFMGKPSVLSLSHVYIRLILNNFIYAILQRINTTPAKKYLQVTLLMPNVYAQKKVYSLISNMYGDFAAIRSKDERYANFLGLEVQALSESDASFIGARSFSGDSRNKIAHKEDASYLVIDAGKGTTDFSIIKQLGRDITRYESAFRTGLPGSGQYITHAYIRAMDKFLQESLLTNGFSLEKIIYGTDNISAIREFMRNMETLKKNHTVYTELTESEKEICVVSIKKSLAGIDHDNFNKYLDNINLFIGREFVFLQKRIPGSHGIMMARIDSFVEQIYKKIQMSQTDSFYQVLFAGRAFQFEPFREAVREKLAARVKAANGFVFHEKNQSKFICVEGAFKNEFCSINLNSELTGCPVVSYVNVAEGRAAAKNEAASQIVMITEQFFYEGMSIKNIEGKMIVIGAREYKIPLNDPKGQRDLNLFYTGDGFILRWDGGGAQLVEEKPSQDVNDMVDATLFPFAQRSLERGAGGGQRGDEGPANDAGNEHNNGDDKDRPDDDHLA